MEHAAGQSLVFTKPVPSEGLDAICACIALWRLKLAGIDDPEACALWARAILTTSSIWRSRHAGPTRRAPRTRLPSSRGGD